MKTIHKYEVTALEDFTVQMPQGAEVLTVQVQGAAVCMWARIDTDRPLGTYRFGVHGTGHELTEFTATAPYVGTFQLGGGALVFHLFGGRVA